MIVSIWKEIKIILQRVMSGIKKVFRIIPENLFCPSREETKSR